MRAEKTIICKVVEPNKGKLEALKQEYGKVQKLIRDEDVEIYSATRQAMDKYVEKDKMKDKKYPIPFLERFWISRRFVVSDLSDLTWMRRESD